MYENVTKLRSFLVVFLSSMFLELAINVCAYYDRSSFMLIVSAQIVQVLMVLILSSCFFFKFTSSMVFRVGMLVILVREFTLEILISIFYFLVAVIYR
jgi:hypothetical protein